MEGEGGFALAMAVAAAADSRTRRRRRNWGVPPQREQAGVSHEHPIAPRAEPWLLQRPLRVRKGTHLHDPDDQPETDDCDAAPTGLGQNGKASLNHPPVANTHTANAAIDTATCE
jgi:hypothetical protein